MAVFEQSIEDLQESIQQAKYNNTHDRIDGRFASEESAGDKLAGMDMQTRANTMRQAYEGWKGDASRKELIAISNYTGTDYHRMNEQLRTGEDLGYDDEIKNTESGVGKGTAPFAFQVTRRMFDGGPAVDGVWSMFEKSKGKIFTDPAFVSTTIDPNEFPSS